MMDNVTFFIYGSCHFSEQLDKNQKVGDGGYGIVIHINGKKVGELSGGYSSTTNSRMDIRALIAGLNYLKHPSNITCYLSNGYVIDTLTKGWLEKWKNTGFKKKKHADLWIELDSILNNHVISLQHPKKIVLSMDYQRAAQLGKSMSTLPNLPKDLTVTDDLILEPTDSAHISPTEPLKLTYIQPIFDSICVNASTLTNTGFIEYRGVDTQTGKIIFSMKYAEATNNIGEFLAIVHALALYKKEGKELKVLYSDNLNAISWVKQKKCKTQYQKTKYNQKVFDHIDRAVKWLENNEYNTKILKWNTAA